MSRYRAAWLGIAQALADGYQPAMMVMAAPCAVAAIVIGLFVSDGGTAPLRRHDACRAPAGPVPAGGNLIQEES